MNFDFSANRDSAKTPLYEIPSPLQRHKKNKNKIISFNQKLTKNMSSENSRRKTFIKRLSTMTTKEIDAIE
jgi:hypothetical protein